MHTYVYTLCVCAYIYAHIRIYIVRIHMHTYVYTLCVYICTHTYIHCMCTYVHIRIYIVCVYTYVHIHIYTHRLPRWHSGEEYSCQCGRCKKHTVDPWVGKTPWSMKWQPASVFLPGKFHGQRSLEGYHPWGCRVRQAWVTKHACVCAHTHTHTHFLYPFIYCQTLRLFTILDCVCSVAKSRPTFCDPMDCGLPGSFVRRFPRQEHWSGLLLHSPGVLPNPGTEPTPLASPALADSFFTTEPPGKPHYTILNYCN